MTNVCRSDVRGVQTHVCQGQDACKGSRGDARTGERVALDCVPCDGVHTAEGLAEYLSPVQRGLRTQLLPPSFFPATTTFLDSPYHNVNTHLVQLPTSWEPNTLHAARRGRAGGCCCCCADCGSLLLAQRGVTQCVPSAAPPAADMSHG